MDTGKGLFEMLIEEKKDTLLHETPGRTDIFSVGEIVFVKDSRFRITKITPKKITLRVLPRIKVLSKPC